MFPLRGIFSNIWLQQTNNNNNHSKFPKKMLSCVVQNRQSEQQNGYDRFSSELVFLINIHFDKLDFFLTKTSSCDILDPDIEMHELVKTKTTFFAWARVFFFGAQGFSYPNTFILLSFFKILVHYYNLCTQ